VKWKQIRETLFRGRWTTPDSVRAGVSGAVAVRNVISGLGNRSDPRPDRGRLPCMLVGPLSRSATIKGGQAGAREPTFTVPTLPPQILATKTDQEGAEARRLVHLATNRRPPTVDSQPPTVTDTMLSSSSAQGISM
jgi:hypothetical protein